MNIKDDQPIMCDIQEFNFIRSLPDAAAVINTASMRYIDVNSEFENLTGYPKTDVLGKTPRELKIVDDTSSFTGFDDIVSACVMFSNIEVVIRTKNDEKRFTLNSGSFFTKENHCCLLIISKDITELRENYIGIDRDPSQCLLADQARKDEVRKYRDFFESIEQGYFEVDLHGNFTFFNDRVSSILGYDKEELLGMNFRNFAAEKTGKSAVNIFNKLLKSKESVRGLVWGFIDKEGKSKKVGLSISIMEDRYGNPKGFRGIAGDISERKLLEEQLTQAQKMESIGQLAAGIAHEINTPNQYVGDNTRFLKDAFEDFKALIDAFIRNHEKAKNKTLTDEDLSEIDDIIEDIDLEYLLEEVPKAINQSLQGLDHVAGIVRAMKEFSHPGTQEKKRTDINKAVLNTVTVTRNEWKYVADLETNLAEDLPMVLCQSNEFNQVLLNIIINAAHAIEDAIDSTGEEKGNITITTKNTQNGVEIRIKDTGKGIPNSIRHRIFDPFFTTKDIGRGTGQGLAISHSVIVKNHGGNIHFETEEGKGTTFVIWLPFEPENQE